MLSQRIWLFLIGLIVAVISPSHSVEVGSCSKDIPKPLAVDIEGCTSPPCKLVDKTTAEINVTFVVPSNSYSLTPKVRAKPLGLFWAPYPLPLEKQNGCSYILNGYCPVDKGEILIYQLQMPLNDYPAISLSIELKLEGDDKEVFNCLRIDCEVVANPNGRKTIIFK